MIVKQFQAMKNNAKKTTMEIMIIVSDAIIFYCVDQRSTRLSRKQNKKVNSKKKQLKSENYDFQSNKNLVSNTILDFK